MREGEDALAQAEQLLKHNQYHAVVDLLSPWVEGHPDDARGWELLAAAHLQRQVWPHANRDGPFKAVTGGDGNGESGNGSPPATARTPSSAGVDSTGGVAVRRWNPATTHPCLAPPPARRNTTHPFGPPTGRWPVLRERRTTARAPGTQRITPIPEASWRAWSPAATDGRHARRLADGVGLRMSLRMKTKLRGARRACAFLYAVCGVDRHRVALYSLSRRTYPPLQTGALTGKGEVLAWADGLGLLSPLR